MFTRFRATLVASTTLLALAACQSESSPLAAVEPSLKTAATGPTAFVKCEARAGRSRISVDGTNLRPLGGRFNARVTSGGKVAVSPAAAAIGDEAEFDFDSNPADIRAGATAIASTFISGAQVTGEIVAADGSVAASATVACRTR